MTSDLIMPMLQSGDGNGEDKVEVMSEGHSMSQPSWIGARAKTSQLVAFGIRVGGGGTHQSKTMMFGEIEALLASDPATIVDFHRAAIEENALGKATASTRSLTLRHLSALYGLRGQPPITQVFLALWKTDTAGRRLQALLLALARDPLLRDTATIVIEGSVGNPIRRPLFEAALSRAHPGRFSEKMLRSLAQNCASTWTQSGHLEGAIRKIRRRVTPSPQSVALAALLAVVCGFGGPAILSSMWMKVLDLSPEDGLDYLRRAEAIGLARVRSAGDVTEISIRQPMAATLGVPELEHV